MKMVPNQYISQYTIQIKGEIIFLSIGIKLVSSVFIHLIWFFIMFS